MTMLKQIREQNGMTMYRLAKETKLSAPYILDLERGARKGKPETWEKIAAVLGCTVDELKKPE